MKFDQFMSYYKGKNFIQTFYKNCDLKTRSRPFGVCKAQPLLENNIYNKQATYMTYVFCTYINYQNLSKSARRPSQIHFYRRSSEYWKGPGTSFRATFFKEFFDNFIL